MRVRAAALLAVLALTLVLLPAGAGSVPLAGSSLLERLEAPIARDLLADDLVPADRNPDLPLRAGDAPRAELFGEADGQTGCGYASYPEDPDDASIKLGLVPYHDIAPTLCAIEQASDRVSVEVIGRSTQGRDLHLVTVTAPESDEEAALQEELHEVVTTNPDQAIDRFDELAEYKVRYFVSGNIHGNEWEGTDASLEVIEDLAFTDDPATLALLEGARLHFVPTINPDGRVQGTRANGAGFDMNRDFVTQSQPETRAVRDALVTTTPLIMLDIHGYTITTLVEPCTRPHNNNYEYDLYIKWALPQAEAMESEILLQTALGAAPLALAAGVDIPYRDREEGWDDWPPIFTPMYAMHHGAIGHTIEVPLPVNTLYSLPAPALQELSRENTIVGRASIEGAFAYAFANRDEMLRDQLEVYRRGMAGEDSPGNDGEGNAVWRDQTFPDAYVIPVGGRQQSATAAARLVDMLSINDVRVARATEDIAIEGETYPAGTYLVDMSQPKRGLANVLLDAGTDISADVANMYDISGWSLGLLWGATVEAVDGPIEGAVEPVTAAGPTGGAPDVDDAAAYALRIDDVAGVRALHALWDAGVPVERAADGTVVLPAEARETLASVAEQTGVLFSPLDALPAERSALGPPRVAAAVTAHERFALDEMGIDFATVSTSALNGDFSLDDFDVLLVSSGLSYSGLNDEGRAKVDEFLAGGGGVVGRGSTGASFNDQAGLLDASRSSGPGGANGVVAVTNEPASPVTGSSPPNAHSFVYGPLWYTSLGDGVRADQRLAEGNPLVAGHWRGAGPEAAAGHALAISGQADAARVVLFGSEPMFRAHPKGLYVQVAEALLWTAQGSR